MTKNRICATATGLPTENILGDCHCNAVILSEMIEAIDMMSNEGTRFDAGRGAVTAAALDRAIQLATDLETLI